MKNYHGHHFEYNVALAQAAAAMGLSTIIAANRQCEKDVIAADGVLPWFRTDWYQSSSGAQASQHFVDDLLDLLNTKAATGRDIVLIHTVSTSEFDALLAYFRRLLWADLATLPTFFILLRRDPAELTMAELRATREALKEVLDCPELDRKLILCTDTQELSEAWIDELGVPVPVMPIPFRHELMTSQMRERPAGAPLSIVYLGDARTEKGYQHLPSVVQEMWPEFIQPGRVHFTIQSNYNTPGGERGIANARLRLQQFPTGVTLPIELVAPEAYFGIMAGADIVVLPYDPERYARRSSGVMNEALAGGKVAVVPAGSWMAAQAPSDQIVVYEHPQGLAQAVMRAVRDFPALSAAAKGRAAAYRMRQNPALFIRSMLDRVSAVEAPSGLPVLFVMDGDSVVNRTGAGSVARQQMAALISYGFQVHAVFQRMHCEDDHTTATARAWMDQLLDEVRGLRLASVWAIGYSPLFSRAGFQPEVRVLPRRHTRLSADTDYRGSFAVPPGLVRLLREQPPALAFVNYVQSLPHVRALVGESVPLICEAVDIQAFQFGLRRGELDEAEVKAEVEALGQADQVIALNPIEAEHFARELGPSRVTYIPPPPSATPVTPEALLGAGDLAELIDRCGPSHPELRPGGRLRAMFAAAPRIDLLYVSSQHGPNLEGLRYFFHHVFYPLLMPQGFTICIAGMICNDLKGLEGPQILLAHRLKDLTPLYAATRTVILPIFDGAGGAVKASEALAFDKPVVATTFALRGIEKAGASLRTHDDWASFGDRILELLNDPAQRLAATRASLALSAATNNTQLYRQRLGRVVEAALGGSQRLPIPTADIRPETVEVSELVEWDATVGLFNRLVKEFALTGYMAPELIQRYRAEPLKGAMLAAARRALIKQTDATRAAQFMGRLLGQGDFDRGLPPEVHVAAAVEARLLALPLGRRAAPIWTNGSPTKTAGAPPWLPTPALEKSQTAMLEQVLGWSSRTLDLRHPLTALSGLHDPEQVGASGRYTRWTGPGPVSEMLLQLDRGYDHEIAIEVTGLTAGSLFETAVLRVDGKPVPTLKWSKELDRRLVALITRDTTARLRPTHLALQLTHTLPAGANDPVAGDNRLLGLQLGPVRVRTALSPAGLSGGASFVQGCVEQMLARPRRDVVNGAYRDLLLRQPDEEGFQHHLDEMRRDEDGSRKLLRVMLGSREFSQVFDNQRLGQLLDETLTRVKVEA